MAVVFSGCALFQNKGDEITEPEETFVNVTVTLCLKDENGEPISGVELTATNLPYEIALLLTKTDENGLTQWQTLTGKQEVLYWYADEKYYKFEGEILETDNNKTITLQKSKETLIGKGIYKFVRES